MIRLMLPVALCLAAPLAAQTPPCPTAEDLATGIRFRIEGGDTESGMGIVRGGNEDGIQGGVIQQSLGGRILRHPGPRGQAGRVFITDGSQYRPRNGSRCEFAGVEGTHVPYPDEADTKLVRLDGHAHTGTTDRLGLPSPDRDYADPPFQGRRMTYRCQKKRRISLICHALCSGTDLKPSQAKVRRMPEIKNSE